MVRSLRLAGGQRSALHWSCQTRGVPDFARRCGRLRRRPHLIRRRFPMPVCCAKIENTAEILHRRISPAQRAKDHSPAIHCWVHGQENNLSPARDERTHPPCLRIPARSGVLRLGRGLLTACACRARPRRLCEGDLPLWANSMGRREDVLADVTTARPPCHLPARLSCYWGKAVNLGVRGRASDGIPEFGDSLLISGLN